MEHNPLCCGGYALMCFSERRELREHCIIRIRHGWMGRWNERASSEFLVTEEDADKRNRMLIKSKSDGRDAMGSMTNDVFSNSGIRSSSNYDSRC